MDTTFTSQAASSNPLRWPLRLDGLFSGAGGILAIAFAQPLAALTGIEPPLALIIVGIGLLDYAALLLWGSTRPHPPTRIATTAIILNVLWIIGSIALLLGGWLPLTAVGKWLIVLLAFLVADFAIWQGWALRRLHR